MARLDPTGNSQAVLNIRWTAPVELKLRLVFSFKAHRPFLQLAARTNVVMLACKPPAASTHLPETITVQPESAVLVAALAAVDMMEVQRR